MIHWTASEFTTRTEMKDIVIATSRKLVIHRPTDLCIPCLDNFPTGGNGWEKKSNPFPSVRKLSRVESEECPFKTWEESDVRTEQVSLLGCPWKSSSSCQNALLSSRHLPKMRFHDCWHWYQLQRPYSVPLQRPSISIHWPTAQLSGWTTM